MENIWESLIASGPLALVLAAACVTLWRTLERERREKDRLLQRLLRVVRGDEDADERDDDEDDG